MYSYAYVSIYKKCVFITNCSADFLKSTSDCNKYHFMLSNSGGNELIKPFKHGSKKIYQDFI